VPAVVGVAVTASMTLPPPLRLAVQPAGTPLSVSATVAVRVEASVRSNETLEPGATATAGNGVVTVRPSAAPTAGTVATRIEIANMSAAAIRACRATLLGKVILLCRWRDPRGRAIRTSGMRRGICQTRSPGATQVW
jgi:hypothetical protein